jgi:DNA-binding transcriptional MerR regulator
MNELVAATGVSKSTILFYLSLGLLPQPCKTSPNMAYYDPASVERIRLIQQMQARHRLTLSEIKRCLDDKNRGKDPGGHLGLSREAFVSGRPRRRLGAKAFCRKTGLSAGQLEEMQQAGLLLPLEEGRFDADDVRMGRMYLDAPGIGIRRSDLAYYAELGERIVDHEMALYSRMTGDFRDQQDAEARTQMLKHARMFRAYIIDRLFQRREAAMKSARENPVPVPEREDQEPWLD